MHPREHLNATSDVTTAEKELTVTVKIHKACAHGSIAIHVDCPLRCTVIDAVKVALSQAHIQNVFLNKDDTLKPGFILIADRIELVSTKQLDLVVRDGLDIHLVSTTHGG